MTANPTNNLSAANPTNTLSAANPTNNPSAATSAANPEAEKWFNNGNEKYLKGDFRGAIASYDQALKIKPDDPEAWYSRGIVAGKLIYNTFFPIFPANPVPLSQLLQNPALDLRDYPGEIASYQEGLKQCPRETHPQGWGFLNHRIGIARYFRGQLASRSDGTSTDEYGQRHKAAHFYHQAVDSYQQALEVIVRFVQPKG